MENITLDSVEILDFAKDNGEFREGDFTNATAVAYLVIDGNEFVAEFQVSDHDFMNGDKDQVSIYSATGEYDGEEDIKEVIGNAILGAVQSKVSNYLDERDSGFAENAQTEGFRDEDAGEYEGEYDHYELTETFGDGRTCWTKTQYRDDTYKFAGRCIIQKNATKDDILAEFAELVE